MEKLRVTDRPENLPAAEYPRFPLTIRADGREFHYDDSRQGCVDDAELPSLIKKEKSAVIEFRSSQSPLVFNKIHALADLFLKDSALKIDAVLRELIKNAEKENVSLIAHRSGIIPSREHHADLSMIGKILQERYWNADTGIPLLYQYPDINVRVDMSIRDTDLHFEVHNSGGITNESREVIARRIQLGLDIAHLDTHQEYEMKRFEALSPVIREFFTREYGEERLEDFWKAAFDEPFDEWWQNTPYFMLLAIGTHSSFYPYFADAYMQLRQAYKKIEKPEESHYSAGMGYIQCAFMLEANRMQLGTHGKMFLPENRDGGTTATFHIGLPTMAPRF